MATARKKPEDKLKLGRPTKYSEEFAALVCERVATHTCGLKRMCAMYDDLPAQSTINLWRFQHPTFSEQYAQAKMIQADLLAEECLEIADEDCGDIKYDKDGNETCNSEFVARSRVRIDTRKWLAAKLLPKQYGDKNKEEDKDEAKSLLEKIISGEIKLKHD